MDPVFKAGKNTEADPYEFILSDESVDRMGDVIRAAGWALSAFKQNPIALFGHDHTQILGTWKDVRIEGKRLLGRLNLAAPGTSELVDSVRSLIDQKILRAVSVGFQPIEAEPRKNGGWEYTRAALHEVSVVAVPANPNAVALAKSFNPLIAEKLLVRADSDEVDAIFKGQSTMKTPNLDNARERLRSLGIDL